MPLQKHQHQTSKHSHACTHLTYMLHPSMSPVQCWAAIHTVHHHRCALVNTIMVEVAAIRANARSCHGLALEAKTKKGCSPESAVVKNVFHPCLPSMSQHAVASHPCLPSMSKHAVASQLQNPSRFIEPHNEASSIKMHCAVRMLHAKLCFTILR